MTGLASASQVHALSQWTGWSLPFERADSDEPLYTHFYRTFMPSRRAVVHAISQYVVGDAVVRRYVCPPGVCQRMQVIGNTK